MLQEIGLTWSFAVGKAVRQLWHAAKVLGFQPDTLAPKHVAMTAATYLGSQDQEPAAGDDVDKAA